jgi:hypothetical protein
MKIANVKTAGIRLDKVDATHLHAIQFIEQLDYPSRSFFLFSSCSVTNL